VDVQSNNKTGAKTMSINISPLDLQINMKQHEPKFGGSTYDHSSQPLTGWRAERQQAENTYVARKDQTETTDEKQLPVISKDWIANIATMFVKPRFAD
jgi:hypothetical protein